KRYMLTDKSPAMVAEALDNVSPCFPQVEHKALAINELTPETVGQFDLIICMHMLYHVPDPEQSLRTLSHLLTERGRLLITTVSDRNNRELLSLHNEVMRSRFGMAGSPPTCWRFDTANAIDLVGSAFHEVQAYYKIADLRLDTTDDAMSYY